MGAVEEYYTAYDEWSRLERHRIEFEMTKRALKEFVKDSSKVLDVGGGPGRYSIFLAEQGHKVTLFDLSENLVKQAAINAAKAGVVLDDIICGNVLELDNLVPDKIYDAVLCMGPMYHLLKEEERQDALRQCLMKLRPGGIIVIAFISAFAPIVDCLKNSPELIKESKEEFLSYFSDGRNYKESGFTDAFFINPDEVEAFAEGFNISKIKFMATEGLGALCEDTLMKLTEDDFIEWLDLFYKVSDSKSILGACEHLLYIGRKVG